GQPGAFRCWLRPVPVHRVRDYWRRRQARPVATRASDFLKILDQLEDTQSRLSWQWDAAHDRPVARWLLALLEPHLEQTTRRALRRDFQDAVQATVAAAELGMSDNAVLLAKSRILRRLRHEMRGLTD